MGIEQTHFTVPVILTIVFLAFSICSCGAVFFHFIFKKSSLSDTPSRLLFCLSLSDLIGAVVWFLDIIIPGLLCPYAGMLNLWGYQSAQFWTCVIGAYLIITCSAKLPPNELVFYVIAWGIPTVIQVIMVCLHLYKVHPAPQGCWVEYGTVVIAFVTFPQILSAVLNLLFLGTIVYKMRISAKRWGLQSRDRGLFFVMICFLLTTVSAFLESIPHGNNTYIIYTIAECFGALQGFINSIAMKQKSILQFMGSVKTKFIPSKRRPSAIRDYLSPSSSTWLLSSDSSPPSSKSVSFNPPRSSFSSPSSAPPPTHPAISDSYKNYYNSKNLGLGRSLGLPNPNPREDMTSMENFSSSSLSPPPLLSHGTPPLTLAPAPLSPEKNSNSIN